MRIFKGKECLSLLCIGMVMFCVTETVLMFVVGLGLVCVVAAAYHYKSGVLPLEERMEAAGMLPMSVILGDAPINPFIVHSGVVDDESFLAWLEMRTGESLRARLRMELDGHVDDEMYEWVFSHSAVFQEVLLNYKASRKSL